MELFKKIILFTDNDGFAKFKEENIVLSEGNSITALSQGLSMNEFQLRRSQIGFKSKFHCTQEPQWLFVIKGIMEITLQDGTKRQFKAGEHFYSADLLPEGVVFDENKHGHSSAQVGDEVLETIFIR